MVEFDAMFMFTFAKIIFVITYSLQDECSYVQKATLISFIKG